MTQLHRNMTAVAALVSCFSFSLLSCAAQTGPADPNNAANPQLEQAASSIVAGAPQSVSAATSDQDAVRRALISVSIIEGIGELGGIDTSEHVGKLLDELRKTAQPPVMEAIVQLQFTNKQRQWQQLSPEDRAAALNSFVSEVKKMGLSRNLAETLARFADTFGERDQSGMVVKAIQEVLPLAKRTNDARSQHTFTLLEGIGRRLDLVGKPLELEGKLLDGGKLNWADYRGKVVLVDFFASWCGPCRAEAPNVLKHYEMYHDKGFEVVGVNLDDDPRKAEQYIKETGCDFPTIFSDDPNANGWQSPLVVKYGINAIPRVMLVDKNGNVVSTSARGPMLGELLAKLLGPADDAGGAAPPSDRNGGAAGRGSAQAARNAALR